MQAEPSFPAPVFRATSNGRVVAGILAFSVVVVIFLFWILYFKAAEGYTSKVVGALPAVNATLNGISSVLLISALFAIRRRNISLHLKLMFSALGSSALFFVSYVIYHNLHGDTKFGGTGLVRPIYFTILISHVTLSIITVPMILTSFYLSLSGQFNAHKKVSRITFPIWLYVSITGVVIFTMLKVFA